MTLAKFIIFSTVWVLFMSELGGLPTHDTLAICLALFCAAAIAKEEK